MVQLVESPWLNLDCHSICEVQLFNSGFGKPFARSRQTLRLAILRSRSVLASQKKHARCFRSLCSPSLSLSSVVRKKMKRSRDIDGVSRVNAHYSPAKPHDHDLVDPTAALQLAAIVRGFFLFADPTQTQRANMHPCKVCWSSSL